MNFDILIVGAGFFGATLAERAADRGLRVLVVEKRSHIGGNCYSEIDSETGIEVHRYGTHIFHTNSEQVWNYVNRFSGFTDYRHHVFSVAKGQVYSLPVNLATICAIYGRYMSADEARLLLQQEIADEEVSTDTLRGKAISTVGPKIYKLLIEGYTAKQWNVHPDLLPAHIISRLPVRFDFNNRYFSDRFEGMPVGGYRALFDRLLSHKNVEIALNVDFLSDQQVPRDTPLIIFTGPIDRYYNFSEGRLGWRTIDLDWQVLPTGNYQGAAVVNYADLDIPYTRIHEFRHLHPERNYPKDKTIIAREFARFSAGDADECYYPINAEADRNRLEAYEALAAGERNVLFGGRLGWYKYLDMHQAIGSALQMFERQIVPFFESDTRDLRLVSKAVPSRLA